MLQVPTDDRLFRIEDGVPVLLGSRCTSCGRHWFPRRRICAVCFESAEAIELSRSGTLYTFTFMPSPRDPAAGIGAGQIDLPEGVRVQSLLLGDPRTWRIDAEMEIVGEVVDSSGDAEQVSYRFAPKEA